MLSLASLLLVAAFSHAAPASELRGPAWTRPEAAPTVAPAPVASPRSARVGAGELREPFAAGAVAPGRREDTAQLRDPFAARPRALAPIGGAEAHAAVELRDPFSAR